MLLARPRGDGLLVALAFLHGVVLLSLPFAPVIGIGLWWNSNTISHHFIHKPFFRLRRLNVFFSLYLSALLGVPQSLWRDRHLAHHAGLRWRLRWRGLLLVEIFLVLTLWCGLLVLLPAFFLTAYLPGTFIGLALCALHGHQEHARGTTSHYGTLYNLLFFNDGYHVEHHRRPGVHWSALPSLYRPGAGTSRWPPVLRWIESFSLETLERMVLRSKALQDLSLAWHEGAFASLLGTLGPVRTAGIVGGGLFPRTALILKKLLPGARLVVIDASATNIQRARPFVDGVEFVHGKYDPVAHAGFDLLVIPLAFHGDREAVYREPGAPAVLVHDWLWRRRGLSAVVSPFLLKRLNLVRP